MESDLEGYSQLTTDDEEVSDEEDSIHSEQSIEEEEPKILLEVLSPGGARLVFLLVYACCAVAIAQYFANFFVDQCAAATTPRPQNGHADAPLHLTEPATRPRGAHTPAAPVAKRGGRSARSVGGGQRGG